MDQVYLTFLLPHLMSNKLSTQMATFNCFQLSLQLLMNGTHQIEVYILLSEHRNKLRKGLDETHSSMATPVSGVLVRYQCGCQLLPLGFFPLVLFKNTTIKMIMGAFVAINAYASVWTMKIKVGEQYFVNSSIKYPRLFCHVRSAMDRLEHHVKKDYGFDSRNVLFYKS